MRFYHKRNGAEVCQTQVNDGCEHVTDEHIGDGFANAYRVGLTNLNLQRLFDVFYNILDVFQAH